MPSKIFATVKGFYVQYSESACAACVGSWNVQVRARAANGRVRASHTLLAGGSSQRLQPPLGQRCAEANVDEHRGTSEATAADLVRFSGLFAVGACSRENSKKAVNIQRGKAGLIARELLPRNFGFMNCSLESVPASRTVPEKGGEQQGAF